MKKRLKNHLSTSSLILTGTAAALTAVPCEGISSPMRPAALPRQQDRLPLSLWQFAFHREGVLGTSFELLVGAVREGDARVCEQQVMAEIERLRLALSTYDPASEINRARAGAALVSGELSALLSAYELWNRRTEGALHVNMAEVIRLWKTATGAPPAMAALQAAFRLPRAWNVDALGKGFIIDRAVAVARRFAPSGVVNIGGDIRAWGGVPWRIGVADPFAPAENASPLAWFTLREGAVATSGGYARFTDLAGKRHSHILDPRTLQPAVGLSSATFAAADCLTANALSTAANVLGMDEGLRLGRQFGAFEHVLVDADRRILSSRTPVMAVADPPAALAVEKKPATEAQPASPAGPAWPTNYQVKINVNLKPPAEGRARRPYVAVWVEDSNQKIVRTIAIWGSEWRWLRELNTWWAASESYQDSFTQTITRATRAPGKYLLVWDGLNDKKQPVPQGEYKVRMEVNREHGRHVTESVTIKCGGDAQATELRATPESDPAKIEYGPKSA